MKRKLLKAAVYREFLFPDAKTLREYLEGGHCYRWIVQTSSCESGIIAIMGEQYNGTEPLKMVKKEEWK